MKITLLNSKFVTEVIPSSLLVYIAKSLNLKSLSFRRRTVRSCENGRREIFMSVIHKESGGKAFRFILRHILGPCSGDYRIGRSSCYRLLSDSYCCDSVCHRFDWMYGSDARPFIYKTASQAYYVIYGGASIPYIVR